MDWDDNSKQEYPQDLEVNWEIIPKHNDKDHPSPEVNWVIVNPDEMKSSERGSKPIFMQPGNKEEAEALLEKIPLVPSDFNE